MLSKTDRLAFSLAIVTADQQIAGLAAASAQLQKISDKDQALDTANSDLFNPKNTLINSYQSEFNLIDGNVRTVIIEQNIQDAAAKKLSNLFFPNNVLLTVPSLSAQNNVWTQIKPFALGFGIGQNYNQTYTSGPAEQGFISSAQTLIASTGIYTDIQLTSGQHCVNGGTCNNVLYTDQTSCESHGGTWTPSEQIVDFPEIHTLNTSLVAAINGIKTQALAEVVAILAITDSDPTRQSQNTAAVNYINSTLLPALNAWLAYSDFNTSHGQTTCAGFNGYNANLLAPTKLHSAQLSVLTSVLAARNTFLTTRVSQLNTNLGSISQNITTGDYTGSGFYKQRFDYLNLRLNIMTGSLTALVSDQQSITAQTQIQSNLVDQKNIYMTIVPTTKLAASGNGTAIISLVDASFYSPGDSVFIVSDTQDELVRAIKSINGKSVQLNDVVPTKYTTLDNVRFYKDIS